MLKYRHKGGLYTRKELANMYNVTYSTIAHYIKKYDISDTEHFKKYLLKISERRPSWSWPMKFKKPEIIEEKIERITQEYGKDNNKRYWAKKGFKRVDYMSYSTK